MKIDRLIAILTVLLNCEKISAGKLAEMFEVTPRTIYRDIDAIAQAGIPVVTYPGANGGIGILPEYKVDKVLFHPDEISTLLMGLGSISTTLSPKEMIGTLEKVKSLIPKEKYQEIVLRSNQISIDLTTWMGSKDFQPKIEKIKQALEECKYLVFQYRDGKGEQRERRVEPYQLVLKEGNWYLQGYCTMREDFRVFKLTRVSRLEVSEAAFIPRAFQAKPLDGAGWIEKRLITIQLQVDEALLEQMMERCGEENIKPCGERQYLVNFPFAADDQGYSILLGFGEKCECLSPQHVREELIRRIKRLLAVYQG